MRSELIRLGYSRDQKKDKKQAVVELNVTAKGAFPYTTASSPATLPTRKRP